jgi:hypothetical protein
MAESDGGVFFKLALPAPWRVERADATSCLEAHAPDGGRVVVWPLAMTAANAAPRVRVETMTVELKRYGVSELTSGTAKLGGEPAIELDYPHDGQAVALLSAVRDGIEYRVTVATPTEQQTRAVVAELAEGFTFPSPEEAQRAAPSLTPSLNALDSALEIVRRSKAVARMGMPGGFLAGQATPPPKKGSI